MSKLFMKSKPPPPVEYTEEQTASNYDIPTYANYYPRAGQRLTIANRKVTKIAFPLKKSASPTGDVTFTIRKVSDDSIIVSKVWGDAADLPTGTTWEEVVLDTPTLVNEEVRLLWEFNGGDSGNPVVGRFQASDVKAGEYRTTYHSGAWEDRTDHDGTYRYKYYEV